MAVRDFFKFILILGVKLVLTNIIFKFFFASCIIRRFRTCCMKYFTKSFSYSQQGRLSLRHPFSSAYSGNLDLLKTLEHNGKQWKTQNGKQWKAQNGKQWKHSCYNADEQNGRLLKFSCVENSRTQWKKVEIRNHEKFSERIENGNKDLLKALEQSGKQLKPRCVENF